MYEISWNIASSLLHKAPPALFCFVSFKCNLIKKTKHMVFIERFSYDLEKWFPQVFVICFISQWMKRTKHGLFAFPPKKTLIWRRHCSIDQSCCSMTSKRFLESSSGMKFFQPSVRLTNQKPGAFVSVR